MEINIELLEDLQLDKKDKNMNVNKRYLNNILGFHNNETQEMGEVKEADNEEDDQDDEQKEFNVRKYLDSECEKMLKAIQKKDKEGFLDIFQDYPEDIDEE